MAHKDDPEDGWQSAYSQQPYQQGSAYFMGNFLGNACATAYAYFGGGGYSGRGQLQYNPMMQEMQSQLGTPTMPKPGKPDPEEIAWLKGRIKEIEWRG